MLDIATRVYNHTFTTDPIIRSVLDTDIYKLLMAQMIHQKYPDINVTFSLINRTNSVKLAEIIDTDELTEQLDYVCNNVRLTKKEKIWLSGNTFYGKSRIFNEQFINWLSNYEFPSYNLSYTNDGQFKIDFSGKWADVSMWEIPVLSIISELRSRAELKNLGRFELDVLYSRAKSRIWDKVTELSELENLRLADFGTRRRHSFLWQNWCVQALSSGLGDRFIGTSNVSIAMNNDLEAIGTNAHELPMVLSSLSDTDDELRDSPYQVLSDWSEFYDDNLLIILPDTYGTTSFLKNAPEWVSDWTGFRIDSKEPIAAGEEIINYYTSRDINPKNKTIIFSDGLDVNEIKKLYTHFTGRIRVGFGWGTNLTNDFTGLYDYTPISLVCKVTGVNGRPTVKLSDNLSKAIGPPDEIERYKMIFGQINVDDMPVIV